MKTKLNVTYHVVANQPINPDGAGYERVKVPEPQAYRGTQDAIKLENFIFDMKQYFRAVGTNSKDTKVSIATKYLIGNAKLWWRSTYDEI